MLKKILLALVALLVVSAVALAVARSRGMIVPGLAAQPLTARDLDGPVATGDSVAIADFAARRCGLLQGKARQTCYEEVLFVLVERGEVRLAMTGLGALSARDPWINARGHEYTHVIGINAWRPGRDVGEMYEQCTGLFQSGCYHGVVQAYLDATGTDSTTVAGLCDLIPAARGNANLWLRFQCVHGLGHGLVQARAMHLPQALAGCDWLWSSWDAESCYGGAFMEFIVAGRGQAHHPRAAADTSAASDDHAHHTPRAPEAAPMDTFPVRDRSDPLFPCSVLDRKYQRSCYGMQAGVIIETTGADFAKIAQACDGAPPGMRPACYQGIGTYVSGFTVLNAERAIELCMAGNPAHRAWCFVGVVKNFIDVSSIPDDGFAFCRMLDDRALAVPCFHAVGEQVAVLKPQPADRALECAKAGPTFMAACRYGALLDVARPAELPVVVPDPVEVRLEPGP